MEEKILNYINSRLSSRHEHQSYCSFPEEACICKRMDNLTVDTPLIKGGFMDSFSMVSVLAFLEKTFDVEIPDRDATPQNFNTVKDMASLVKKYKR